LAVYIKAGSTILKKRHIPSSLMIICPLNANKKHFYSSGYFNREMFV